MTAKCQNTGSASAPGVIDPPTFRLRDIGGDFDFDLFAARSRLELRVVPTAAWTTPAAFGVSCSFSLPAATVFAGPVAIELAFKVTASSSVSGSVTVTGKAPLTLGYLSSGGSASSLNTGGGLLDVADVAHTGGELRLAAAAVLTAKYLGVLGI